MLNGPKRQFITHHFIWWPPSLKILGVDVLKKGLKKSEHQLQLMWIPLYSFPLDCVSMYV